MVVRKGHTNPQPQSPAQMRAAAQRRIAREIKSGTYQPSKIGQRSRQIVQTRAQLVAQIQQQKIEKFGTNPKFNAGRSEQAVDVNQDTNKARSVKQLQKILQYLEDDIDPGDVEDTDYESALYYH